MTGTLWEDSISLNSRAELDDEVLPGVAAFLEQETGEVGWDRARFPLQDAVAKDPWPLPTTQQREGYYGANHFNYWTSGLRDYCQLVEWLEQDGAPMNSLLDLGCASGRLLRHAALQGGVREVYGADINRLHVEWINRRLSPGILAFQNTSLPILPLPDASLDVVTAFSVFTHVESFVSAWLLEIRRVLKPGGVAWLTVHADRTWREVDPTWPLFGPLDAHPDYAPLRGQKDLPSDRLVFRWKDDASYSSNVFYKEDYLRSAWGRVMPVVDLFPTLPAYQDIVVMRKA